MQERQVISLEQKQQIFHDLAMLYLKNLDTSSMSPSELFDTYQKAKAEIKERSTQNYEKWF